MNSPARLPAALLLVFFFVPSAWASQPVKVAVHPFVATVQQQEITGGKGGVAMIDVPVLSQPWAARQVRDWLSQTTAAFFAKNEAGADSFLEARIVWRAEAGRRLLSLRYTVQEYLGGAHPATYPETFVFDMRTGRRFAVSELFMKPEQGLEYLAGEAGIQLGLEPGQLRPVPEQFRFFGLGRDGVHLFFPPYQFGARIDGEQPVVVPYSLLHSVLQPAIADRLAQETDQ